MKDLIIRNETAADHQAVENLTREAFWNLHVPGCDEHYLVHVMREHPDFIPPLDLVAVLDEKIVGNIMYTKSFIMTDDKRRFETITFGPISVLPGHQRQGIGKALINRSREIALALGYRAIVILGSPYDYCTHGFTSAKDFGVRDPSGAYPLGLLVLELEKGALMGKSGEFHYSDVYEIDEREAALFDRKFPPKQKSHQPSQDVFGILVRAYIH
jgi:putative acetyltransferase